MHRDHTPTTMVVGSPRGQRLCNLRAVQPQRCQTMVRAWERLYG
jgi:hypothetical protein